MMTSSTLTGSVDAWAILQLMKSEGEDVPTAGQVGKGEREIAEHGPKSLEKSVRSLEKQIAEHLGKIEEAKRTGGETGFMEKEVENFRRTIEAIKRVLGR